LNRWSTASGVSKLKPGERNFLLWATGRLATAAAALELSAQRAETETAPWPEFSEMNCNACHQELNAEPIATKKIIGKSDTQLWGSWFLSGTELLIPHNQTGLAINQELPGPVMRLMHSPQPSRRKTAEASRSLSPKFQSLAESRLGLDINSNEVQSMIQKILSRPVDTAARAWDTEAQNYLALSALAKSFNKQFNSPEVIQRLKELKFRLEDHSNMTNKP